MLLRLVRIFQFLWVHFFVAQFVDVLIQTRLWHDLRWFHVHKVLRFKQRLLRVLVPHDSILEIFHTLIRQSLLARALTSHFLSGLFCAQVIFHKHFSGCVLTGMSPPHELHLTVVFKFRWPDLVFLDFFQFIVTELLLQVALLAAQYFLL